MSDKKTLTLDPIDVERKISEKTKAIIVVHYFGYPTDMDSIMDIAKKHDVKVIEDVSHAHGGLYKGELLGTIGDVGAMSVMSEKGLAIGEGGFLITRDKNIYALKKAILLAPNDTNNPEAKWIEYSKVENILTHPEDKKFYRQLIHSLIDLI